jgi:hypothetical protein
MKKLLNTEAEKIITMKPKTNTILFIGLFLIIFVLGCTQPVEQPTGQQTTTIPTTNVSIDKSCKLNEDCSSTCCGCVNSKEAMRCTLGCPADELMTCVCVDNLCQVTDIPLP